MSSTAATPPPSGKIFGHPKGLAFLFFTEMWERFSFYGMRALLTLYMVKYLFIQPEVGQQVLGYTALKNLLEQTFGIMTTQQFSSQVYGLYIGFVYFSPFFGGLLADRVLGQRKAVILGAILMAIGHFLMAIQSAFLPALLFLILGNGAFKPNISTQVGNLYAPGDSLRDRAFSIFYVGINIGAFFSPLLCGTLGETYGWHYGFGLAGIGMLVGLVIYLTGQKYLAAEPAADRARMNTPKMASYIALYTLGLAAFVVAIIASFALPKFIHLAVAVVLAVFLVKWIAGLHGTERPRVVALIVLCFFTIFFWSTYEQQGNTFALWVDTYTDKHIFGWEMPTTWFQAFNPFMVFAFTPFVVMLWAKQARKGKEPTSAAKMAIGCIILGLSYVVMIFAALGIEDGGKNNLLWLVATVVLLTIGELYVSPVGLSLVTKLAPVRFVSMLMGVWFLANFVGNYGAGYLGTFFNVWPKPVFFGVLGAIAGATGLLILVVLRPIHKAIGNSEAAGGV